MNVLILGGTGEAAKLAHALDMAYGARLAIMTSLAGRTAARPPLPGLVRVGGFGGMEGLRHYLGNAGIKAVIDATHPFAATISAHARVACEGARVPRIQLMRPPWRIGAGDRWIMVRDMEDAASALATLHREEGRRRALVTTGQAGLASFAPLASVAPGAGLRFTVRLIAPPRTPLPLPGAAMIIARPPHTLAAERALLAGMDILVTKASGGEATAAKLTAAREHALPVVMLRRPPPEPGPQAESVEDAMAWLRNTLKGVG